MGDARHGRDGDGARDMTGGFQVGDRVEVVEWSPLSEHGLRGVVSSVTTTLRENYARNAAVVGMTLREYVRALEKKYGGPLPRGWRRRRYPVVTLDVGGPVQIPMSVAINPSHLRKVGGGPGQN